MHLQARKLKGHDSAPGRTENVSAKVRRFNVANLCAQSTGLAGNSLRRGFAGGAVGAVFLALETMMHSTIPQHCVYASR